MEPTRIIEEAFVERKKRNPAYSLRGFARDLGLSAAQLSRILNQKRTLTPFQAARIAAALKLPGDEAKKFVQTAVVQAPANARIRTSLRKKAKHDLKLQKQSEPLKMSNYSVERFRAISEWYHIAILELTFLDEFQSDPIWIANALGISKIEAKQAVSRLLDLGFLEPCPKNGTRKTQKHLFLKTERSEPEVRKFDMAMIEKASLELSHISGESFDSRLINSITFPASIRAIPELKSMIIEFQRKILKFIQENEFDEVYQFNCQLFPLSKTQTHKIKR